MSTSTLNPDWANLPLFDRTGWRTLPFGEFAQSINERVDPSEAAEDIYVGLEHLDPRSLHIRRWGKGSDVIGTKLRFRKGDIIFGRRRAYQRKLAVAEFDGICSAHAMVVRAKPEVVLPEFLPFLMMSDRFMNRAVEISVGSLSPTINWKTLKLEEFALPPLAQQHRIAEILCAVDEVRIRWVLTAEAARKAQQSKVAEFRYSYPRKVGCGEVVVLSSGKAKPKDIQLHLNAENNIPVFGGNGVIGYTKLPLLAEPTVIVGRVGEYCGCVHLSEGKAWVTDNAIFVKEHDNRLSRKFLYWMLVASNLNRKKKIAGQPLISQSTIMEQEVPLPPLDEQSMFLESVEQLSGMIEASTAQCINSSALFGAITNTLFGQP